MKLLVALLLVSTSLHALTAIVGTFKYPDGTALNGRVVIRITRSTVTNTCATPNQLIPFQPVTVNINNGLLDAISLYATSCLSPRVKYQVNVYDKNNTLVYADYWNVPNTGSADVTQIGNGN